MEILKYLKDINICLIILDALFFIVSFLFLNKKKSSDRKKDLFVIIYTLVNILFYGYFNYLFNNIFSFDYLNIKIYLIIILIMYVIFLVSINKNIKLRYKIVNYFIFVLTSLSLFVNIYILLTNRVKVLSLIDLDYSVMLMNVTEVLFISYVILIEIIYIFSFLVDKIFSKRKSKKVKINKEVNSIEELM